MKSRSFATSLLLLLIAGATWSAPAAVGGELSETEFVRGDCDDDGSVALADVLFLLRYLFLDGPPPTCLPACDTNDSGGFPDIADAKFLLSYLFNDGSPPPAPFEEPGTDPTRKPGDPDCDSEQPQLLVRRGDQTETLDGRILRDDVYITVFPAAGIERVQFFLDDTDAKGTPHRTEENAPFDFNGGTATEPTPWDTTEIIDGTHTITAALELENGVVQRISAEFEVANKPPDFGFIPPSLRRSFLLDEPETLELTLNLTVADKEDDVEFSLVDDLPDWLEATPASGTLPEKIELTIDSSDLALGDHLATLTATIDGQPPATFELVVGIHKKAEELSTVIRRHDIEWTLDARYPVGRFANGDYYVVGPVIVESVAPEWNGEHHGAMINPVWAKKHGYDGRPGMPSYDSSLRVSFPRQLFADDSLMSVRSWENDEDGHPSLGTTPGNTDEIPLPAFRDAAVLTVVSEVPPKGSFRPAYGGTDKTLYNISDLQASLLPSLDKLDETPDIEDLTDQFDRVWMDHGWKWMTSVLNATDNSPSYGREIAARYNSGTLALMLDFTDDEKELLLLYLVQIGIDYYGQLQAGAEWGTHGGGLGSGRKWPVLFAGVMLDDADIKNAYIDTYGPETSQEDCQTYYDESAFPSWHSTYCYDPDSAPSNYQFCCTANGWVGAVLSVHILTGETDVDVKELWNHDALFDYQDWFMGEREAGDWQRSWSSFAENMWDEYREEYGEVWSDGK